MRKILITECADQAGLIANITTICFRHGLNIIKNNEYVDHSSNTFFMRTELEHHQTLDAEMLLKELDQILPEKAQRRLIEEKRKRIVILATKEAHCLGELLMKHYYGALEVDIAAVISNHNVLAPLVEKFDIPFHFVDHHDRSRNDHEHTVLELLDTYHADYIVLAKYMRILSSEFVRQYPNQILNIHHSFLPAFVGARPYHQAFERGVKIIGATAHFVNDELDQGPIIYQDVIHVDHSYQAQHLAQAGQQLEESVLLNALQLLVRDKVFVYGNRTVVFA